MLEIPKSKEEFKKLPIGTKLRLIRRMTGNCNEIRIINQIRSKDIVFLTEKGDVSYLVLTKNEKFFHTEKTFGLLDAISNTILVEYEFVKEQTNETTV